jgi:glyoxylase-like metal-dependent hydrolase (beta-lactamase superfamily II)
MAEKPLYVLRINGRGNAWPNPIGQKHPFYAENEPIDYANASFSIQSIDGPGRGRQILWELLVDAGHGCIPMLLNSFNRLPEALFITHPHFDHILGVDWIAQSYYRYHDKQKYPLYATEACWGKMCSIISHLQEIVAFNELPYGIPVDVSEAPGVCATALPVYHGPHATGASMLLFILNGKNRNRKILFTGDVLTPLLRADDHELVFGTDILVADSNNRFPYPRCNHWSLVSGADFPDHAFLKEWQDSIRLDQLLEPHATEQGRVQEYFNGMQEAGIKKVMCTTVMDFVDRIRPEKVLLVHYGGMEDERYYHDRILTASELQNWTRAEAARRESAAVFIVPDTGSMFEL